MEISNAHPNASPLNEPTASPATWRFWLGSLDKALAAITNILVALLVLAEIVIVSAGVVSRYVFNSPLDWSDALASMFFTWLIMLGIVIAERQGSHLRLTILFNDQVVGRIAQKRPWVEAIAAIVSTAFMTALLQPACDYAANQIYINVPGLDISDAWRAAALPIGALLLILALGSRALQRFSVRHLLFAACLVLLVGTAFWLCLPLYKALGKYNLMIFFVGLVTTSVVLSVPIGFSFGLATVAYLSLTTNVPLSVVVNSMQDGMSNPILLAIPLFVILGQLMEITGMARVMIEFLTALLGGVKGGLCYVLLGAMYIMSGISGSKAADMAAITPILFPELKQRGHKPGELVALLASSAAMSETIPPSLVLIIIGTVSNVSIGDLFAAGLLPALVLAVALAIIARYRTGDDAQHRGLPRAQADVHNASTRTILHRFVLAAPALVLPFIIRSAVVEGVATATEVSTIGIAYAVLCGLVIYRKFDWGRIFSILLETASITGSILIILGSANAMGWSLTQSGFSKDLAQAMAAVPGGAAGFMIVSIVLFVLLGSVLEGVPALVLFGPLLFPIARSVGIHEVQYAIVAILAMGIGLFTPPLGVGYYTACAIGRVNPDEGMRPIWPYVGALFVGLLIVAAIPWISIGFL